MSMLFLAIPLTLFVLFVLPVWLWLHYNNRGANGSLTQNEQQRLLQFQLNLLLLAQPQNLRWQHECY